MTSRPFSSVRLIYGISTVKGPALDPIVNIGHPHAAWLMLAALAVAEFLGMTLWFSATAVTPVLVADFGMSSTHASWLTIAVQAGFVVGTLASAIANLA